LLARIFAESGSYIYRFSLKVPAIDEQFAFTSSRELIHALETVVSQIPIQERAEAEDDPD
jgi:hypothetical protein